MREVVFLKKNRDKWASFEKLLNNPSDTDPDKLADLYLQLIDDLSYAQTFYPHSKTRAYLNRLAAQTYLALYVNQKTRGNRLLTFFKTDIPLAVAKHFPVYVLTGLGLVVIALVAMFISAQDLNFVSAILGEQYVQMTIDNIRNHDPTGVYKSNSMDMFEMFTRIAFNNIRVMIYAFASGILLGLPTLYIFFINSTMLGTFFYLFYHYNVEAQAWRIILIHGTMEIWCIILGCAAGFILGKSVIQPGTFSRIYALKQAALEGMKILVGLFPFILFAAFLESYVTRYSDMPIILNHLIILVTGGIMFFYWGILPYIYRNKLIIDRKKYIRF